MDTDERNTKKRIPVSQIAPGMYIVGLDRSWFQTPFYLHRGLIKNADEIELLKKLGIREVIIDTARGVDIEASRSEPPAVIPAGVRKENQPTLPSAHEPFQPLIKELEVARTIHAEAITMAQTIFDGVGSGSPLNSPIARKVVASLLESITRSPEANLLLTQMRRFQHDLFTHAVNVCVLCLVVGTVENFDGELSALGLGALLHDVGETRLPRNLLRKQKSHTTSERQLMEQHPKLGAILLDRSENIPALTRRIVAEHHERLDGSGYPFAIRGEQISLFSQLVAIADLYDLMLTGRNQAALQPIEVLRELYFQGHAGAFPYDLIERIIRCLGVYPAGSVVELNTGERGIVVAANRNDTLRPTLRIISSRSGLALPKGPIISLGEADSGSTERRIVRALDPGKERVDVLAYLKLASAAAG
jgi:HD-GYP domain-containing protein (c-di-GMP phosphodiesterase class II)